MNLADSVLLLKELAAGFDAELVRLTDTLAKERAAADARWKAAQDSAREEMIQKLTKQFSAKKKSRP